MLIRDSQRVNPSAYALRATARQAPHMGRQQGPWLAEAGMKYGSEGGG